MLETEGQLDSALCPSGVVILHTRYDLGIWGVWIVDGWDVGAHYCCLIYDTLYARPQCATTRLIHVYDEDCCSLPLQGSSALLFFIIHES